VDSDSKLNLKASFPPPSYDEWLAAVNESLKGADFDKVMKTKTEEGIVLQPIYRRADIAGLAFTIAFLICTLPACNNPQGFCRKAG
jgi:methylmalonyl-CoA mutase